MTSSGPARARWGVGVAGLRRAAPGPSDGPYDAAVARGAGLHGGSAPGPLDGSHPALRHGDHEPFAESTEPNEHGGGPDRGAGDVTRPVASIVTTAYLTPVALLASASTASSARPCTTSSWCWWSTATSSPRARSWSTRSHGPTSASSCSDPGRVGRAQALNLGLDAARSPLIGIQDADDASPPRPPRDPDARLLKLTPKLALLGADAQVSASVTATRRLDRSTRRRSQGHRASAARCCGPTRWSTRRCWPGARRSSRGGRLRRAPRGPVRLRPAPAAANRGVAIGHCDLPLVLQRRHPRPVLRGSGPGQPGMGLVPPAAHPHQPAARTARCGLPGDRRPAPASCTRSPAGIAWHRLSNRQEGRTPSPVRLTASRSPADPLPARPRPPHSETSTPHG